MRAAELANDRHGFAGGGGEDSGQRLALTLQLPQPADLGVEPAQTLAHRGDRVGGRCIVARRHRTAPRSDYRSRLSNSNLCRLLTSNRRLRFVDDDGNLVMHLSDPDYKAMLKVMNELYLAGYINQENFAYNDEEQAFQNFYAGNVFMVSYFAGNDEQRFTAKLQAAVPGAKVVQVPLMEKWTYTIPVSGWAAQFITKDCDDPERAIKMLYWAKQKDNSISLTYGVKGIDWDYDEIGNIKILERRQKSADAGTVAQDYKEMGFPLSADDYITIYNAFYAAATPETRAIFDEVVKRATISNAISLAMPKSGSEEQFIYSDLESLATEYFPRLCMAESPEAFDALYDEMMQVAVDNGLEEVNAYLTKTYNDVKELLGAE